MTEVLHGLPVPTPITITVEINMDNISSQLLLGGGGYTAPPGESTYINPGSYTWTVPAGVSTISLVAVGSSRNGHGGDLVWANDIPVTPGQAVNVVVGYLGTGGYPAPDYPTSVSLNRPGGGAIDITSGVNGASTVEGLSSNYRINAGGRAGTGTNAGGGGAGGYTGSGGAGGNSNGPPSALQGQAGVGGAGGGGARQGNGGGVGLYGKGANGAGTSGGANYSHGVGGSGGQSGSLGGKYGGGKVSDTYNYVGNGAVRIIWPGNLRQFPSTRTQPE